MEQVTDTNQVKADLAGRYATRLAVVLQSLEIHAKHTHDVRHAVDKEYHASKFQHCLHPTCSQTRHLIENTRQMISQGV